MTDLPLIPSVSIAALLQRRNDILANLREAFERIRRAKELAKNTGFPGIEFTAYRQMRGRAPVIATQRDPTWDGGGGAGALEDVVEFARQVVDAGAWAFLMDQSGLRTFMSEKARAEWDAALTDGAAVPPLTKETIIATFQGLHERRGEMLDEGIAEIFHSLSWNYKSNSPVMFGKRLVLRHVVSAWGGSRQLDKLDDLERVFFKSDNKPEPDHRSALASQIRRQRCGNSAFTVEDEYLTVRIFKNGNGHLTFKRPDLVDELNRIIARIHPNALPADR